MKNHNVLFAIEQKHYVSKLKEEYTYKSLGTDFDRDEMLETFPVQEHFHKLY